MSGTRSDTPEERLRDADGWDSGARPGLGRGGELDKAVAERAPEADPALRSPVPGFTEAPDATEALVEGEGVSQARNAIEDLPRQG